MSPQRPHFRPHAPPSGLLRTSGWGRSHPWAPPGRADRSPEERWPACSAAQTHVHLSPAGRSLEESPEALRTFEEFVESKGLNKTEMVSPSHVGKSRIPPSFSSWVGPEARPRGCPRVCVPRQARRQTSTGPHLLVQPPVLEEHLAPESTGRHRAPPAPARGATPSPRSQCRPQQGRTHPFLTDGRGDRGQ